MALFAVGLLMLRFVPEEPLYVGDGGGFAPSRPDLLVVFVRYTWWAIGGLTVFGLLGGWLLAGIMLRPLARITDVARRVHDGDLALRVTLHGRHDELTDLADAFDAMLEQVEHTIDEERRFAANASHELRTPHAIIRTIVEVAQADPGGRDMGVVLQRIGDTNNRAITSTEALLTLARIGRGTVPRTSTVDLAPLIAAAVEEESANALSRGIRSDVTLSNGVAMGERTLLTLLVSNLVRNAVTHNVDHGWVRISLTESSAVELVVENSGPLIAPAVVATLTQPFVRGTGRVRSTGDAGSGLGLAIVASVIRAHGGELRVAGRDDGGLKVCVTLPR
ncbi:HAMP domain-containing histidine kinase [Acaricomes phytoseiuli]|uniref:sensor histidine kinase n=1 Tax=Acaricomes phytoseiuli TaxID=291968 RepID=UPI0022238F71|nr:HAMP domain-containing sensor histidine kinase [Acaricomes phytoseiuli]MCW1250424.1 HAMP domain-containing histidine kinase [Acaricomes phytoseiuli]